MSIDERDTRLGELLDRAVRAVEVEGVPNDVVSRGSRRRAGTLVAAVTAAAVFVAGVGFAATQVGRDAGRKPARLEGWTTLSAPDIPWSMAVPSGWRVGASHFVGGPQHKVQHLRFSFVTNVATRLPQYAPSFGSPLKGRGPVEDNTVAVLVDQFVGQGESRPTSLTFNAVQRIAGAEGWTSRDGKICSVWGCVRVYLVQGPAASGPDIDTATRVAESVEPVRLAPSPTTLVPTIQYEDQDFQAGYSMRYPAGWVVADDPLTDLIDPSEIATIGTYQLQPGGRTREGFDAVIPAALDQLGPEDVFITLQEYDGARLGGTPMRPAGFAPDTVCSDQVCVDGRSLGFDGMRAWWVSFEDAASDRTFSALVAMGEAAFDDSARFGAAWSVLDSLEFDRSGEALILPPPVRKEYRIVFVSDEQGYRFWPISGPAEEGVRYRFEVGHCGLEHLTDFDGSFWEPILPHGEGFDLPLNNSDRGTIRMTDPTQAIYTSSGGDKVALIRVDGPILRGGCA